ncbi:Arc family DNA-binding protein [Moraxella sp. Tifton1]|uniref:Arc family DNA-binding protein n=1 Tax=Moraxella oculi TaxID=2940516 RepID=UPI00201205C1|nr:Arc family DNA-binding protein [Moraxella sp. Tifton1]MCL1623375.1 Arc family DNA-binding protein [Moraxella sp. Tifton1]
MGQHLNVDFKIRLPHELKDKLNQSAEKHNRTMTADIVARLETTFNTIVENEIYGYNDMTEPAMTVHLHDIVIGLMQSQYKDIKVQKNPFNDTWVLSYHALRCTIDEKFAQALIHKGCSTI